MTDPRYPIGAFDLQEEVTEDDVVRALAHITALREREGW